MRGMAEFTDKVVTDIARNNANLRTREQAADAYVTAGAQEARMGALRLAWQAERERTDVPTDDLLRVIDASRSFAVARYHEASEDNRALRAANGWGI